MLPLARFNRKESWSYYPESWDSCEIPLSKLVEIYVIIEIHRLAPGVPARDEVALPEHLLHLVRLQDVVRATRPAPAQGPEVAEVAVVHRPGWGGPRLGGGGVAAPDA